MATNDNTIQGWISLERSILYVASPVAEDSSQELLLRRRVALALRRNLADEDIAVMDMSTDTYDAILVKVLSRLFTYVRNVGSEFLHASLCVANLKRVLVDMHRGEYVLTHDTLRDDDGVLEVITLPRHERHLQIPTQSQFAISRRIALRKDLPLDDALPWQDYRTQVNTRALIRLLELRQNVLLGVRVKANETLILGPVIVDNYLVCINIGDIAIHLSHHLRTREPDDRLLQACPDDRRLSTKQRDGLPHHVRTHERTVCVVVLKERDEGRSDRGNLVGSNVNQLNLILVDNREVAVLTCLHPVLEHVALVVHRGDRLSYNLMLLLFGRHILEALFREVDLAILHTAIRRLQETKTVYLRKDSQRRYQTNVRAFWRLNRAKPAIVSVVDVAHLETRAVSRQTSRAKGRQTTLVSDLGKRVSLVHELRQCIRSKEAVDDRRQRLAVDKLCRREHLVVAHIHALAYSPSHTSKTNTELVCQLLANSAHAAVAQVVDIVNISLGVQESYEPLYNLYDVLLREDTHRHVDILTKPLIEPVTTYVTKVVTLVREEKFLNGVASRRLIGRIGIAQLPVYIYDGILLRVASILLQRIVDDGEICQILPLLVQKNSLSPRVEDVT